MHTLALWFLIFISYSFIGWAMEVSISIFMRRKLVNRGFLVGPVCPIYGVGGVIISLLLQRTESPLAIFCVSTVGAAILEYTTSYLMEKIFRVRWWDYSDQPFNLNGRICVGALFGFGIAGILIVEVFTPALLSLYTNLPPIALYLVAGILAAAFLGDIILSLWLVLGVRVTVGTVQKDATGEISERVHQILVNKGKLNRRLVKAFPNQSPSQKNPRAKTAKTNARQKPKNRV